MAEYGFNHAGAFRAGPTRHPREVAGQVLRWQVVAATAASLAAGLALAEAVSPAYLMNAIIYSPPGLVLVGRLAMVYIPLYELTGSTHLSLAAGILFTNAVTVGTSLAAPLALHASHGLGLRMRGRRWRGPRWLLYPDWRLSQIIMLFVSLYLAAFTGFSVAAVSLARSPAAFMLPETLYVVLAASAVYAASRLPYEGFVARYKSILRKTVPAIAALMVVSAVVEAYEVL